MKPAPGKRDSVAAITGLLLVILMASSPLAQQTTPQRARPVSRNRGAEPPPAPAKLPPPPANAQEKPLLDLSETIGGLTFLSQICTPAALPNPWRIRMEALLESEGENSGVRDKMAGAFNHGFSDYSTTYRQCTDAARAARRILTRDAARLARDIERRFGS